MRPSRLYKWKRVGVKTLTSEMREIFMLGVKGVRISLVICIP